VTAQGTFRDALNAAMADAMQADERVLVLGEDVAAAGGAFKVTDGLFERFGARRVLDTPISEQAIVGAAIGAAVRGLRPVAEIMFADFAAVCFDGIANELAKYRYMTGGQVEVPVVIRMANGGANGFGAQHSQTCENWFLNVPGLRVVVPATPADAYEQLRAAIAHDDPVLFFEHKGLYNRKGAFNPHAPSFSIDGAALVRPGEDVTVVATQLMRHRAAEAIEQLDARGISAELIDMRVVAPLDVATVAESVGRTNRLVVVQEAPPDGSWGASLIARVTQQCLEWFDAPPTLVASDETPVPYAAELERSWSPSVERVVEAVEAVCRY
jgi:acetoin:2,6-dichlorophenolindophenol oxidoreductase subunit beta